MARIIILIFLISVSVVAKAQLTDILGELSIQGAITNQSTKSVGQGLSSLQKLQILQEIRQISSEIQTLYLGNYTYISKNSLSQNYLTNLDWNIIDENNVFYIQLNQINKDLCSYLIQNKISESDIQVNENNDKICKEINTIKYYFK